MRAPLSLLAAAALCSGASLGPDAGKPHFDMSNITELINPSLLTPLRRNLMLSVSLNGSSLEPWAPGPDSLNHQGPGHQGPDSLGPGHQGPDSLGHQGPDSLGHQGPDSLGHQGPDSQGPGHLLHPSLVTPLRSLQDRAATGHCGCGHSVTNPATGRIVGGEESGMHSRPYQLYLQSCSSAGCAMCGATLLNRRYAMTAMHCVESASSLVVAVGEHNIRADIEQHTTKSIKVERVIKRADYDTNTVNNDIALLRLAEDVVLSESIVPACLPSDPAHTYEGYIAVVSGWGTTSSGGSTSDVLKETQQTILAATAPECVQGAGGAGATQPVPDSKLCGYKSGTDSCQGDSGGPLVVMEGGKWTVVGVVSYGFGCASPGFAGIYARVTHYLDWIQANIADGWCEEDTATTGAGGGVEFPGTTTLAPYTSQQWCDFRCTNVGSLTAPTVSLNGIPTTCVSGFCRATDSTDLCTTFNYPCGTAQPSGALVATTTTTTTTTTTARPTASLSCSRPCDLSLALSSLMDTYRYGLYNIIVGPSWNRVPAVADMASGLACPTDQPDSDLCQRLGLFGLFGK